MNMAVESSPALSFTTAAALRVYELLEEEQNYNLKLRIYITGGGCSGFQYGFAFDEKEKSDDYIIQKIIPRSKEEEDEEEDGESGRGRTVKLIIDPLSMMYLRGAEVDYKESLQGAHFTVKNPNAQTTCSCGSSFSL